MADHQAPPKQLTAPNSNSTCQFLTVNMVMPTAGDSAKQGASFARLLFGLTALALERFGAVPENERKDAAPERQRKRDGLLSLSLPESMSSCLAGIPVDPFDGQLLRFRQTDAGYQLHSAGHYATAAQVGERDPGLQVVDSTLI